MPGGVQEGKTGFYFLPILHICHSCGNIDKYKALEVFTCHMLWQFKDKWSWIWPLAQSVQWITSRFVCGGKFLRHCPFHSLDLFFTGFVSVNVERFFWPIFVEKYFNSVHIIFPPENWKNTHCSVFTDYLWGKKRDIFFFIFSRAHVFEWLPKNGKVGPFECED